MAVICRVSATKLRQYRTGHLIPGDLFLFPGRGLVEPGLQEGEDRHRSAIALAAGENAVIPAPILFPDLPEQFVQTLAV